MAEPKVQTAFWVTFDLIKIADGSTLTTRFGDFSYLSDDDIKLFSTAADVYGGLLDITGFELAVGDPLPIRNGGSITLDTTRGVMGRDLRISDLLKDYFWINSRVTVNSFKKSPDSTGSSTDVRIEFIGSVKDLDYSPQNSQLRISVEPIPINTNFEQEIISLSKFPNATENFGKYLPLCIGNPTVPGYVVYSDDYTGSYSYSTSPSGYSNNDATAFYTTNNLNRWVEVTDEGLTNPTFGNTSGTTTGRTLVAPYNAGATPPASRSFRQRFTATKDYLGQRIKIYLKNVTGGAVTYNMFVFCRVYKKTKSVEGDIEFQLLGTGSEEIDGTSVANNGTYNSIIIFDQPIPFEIGKRYFIEVSIAGNENQVADYEIDILTLAETGSNLYRREGTAADFDRILKDRAFNWEITGYLFDDVLVSNVNNITISPNILPAGIEESTFDDLDIIIKSGGLRDDASGTITGTALSAINDPYEVTRFLLRDQLSFLDTTTFDAANVVRTKYPRTVQGFTKGRESNEQILSDILRQTACKLVPRNDGLSTKMWALYPYGYQTSNIRYLTEQDCRLTRFDMTGQASIVNDIEVAYEETSIPGVTAIPGSGNPKNFKQFKTYSNATGGNWTLWTNESYSRFGTRPLNNGWTQLDWIGTEASADFYAQYILQSFARPRVVVDLELPFFESDFRTIQCMDVIELSHPDMPATFGTTPDSLTPPPVYNGQVVETANFGLPLRRAQSYRLQVISRQVIFNIRGNKAPVLALSCRLLWNPYEIY